MRLYASCALASAALAACQSSAGAPAVGGQPSNPVFVGNYLTGNIGQWPGHEFPPGGIVVGKHLTSVAPPKPYRYVARFTIGAGGPAARRSEVHRLAAPNDGTPGVDTYWRWYIYFPRGFHGPPNGDMLLSDWHQTGGYCSPPIIFDTQNGRSVFVRIRAGASRMQSWPPGTHFPPLDPGYEGRTFQGPYAACETQTARKLTVIKRIRPNHWYQIVLHINWSSDPKVGVFTAWVDGCRMTPAPGSPGYHFATMMDLKYGRAWLKQGIYDPHGWPAGTPRSSVFYTGTTQYGSYRDVWPRPPVCRR
jgi:hypothetical protein